MQNSFKDRFLTSIQYIIPQHLLSKLVLKLTRLQWGRFTHWLIKRFIKYYNVDMSIANLPEISNYASFNQFFTRALNPIARPLATGIVSPVDAEISQIGKIEVDNLLQAKGHSFKLTDLLGGNKEVSSLFEQGLFCTLYLSPKDYHRIHTPVTSKLTDMIYVPGRLFSVNQRTTRVIPNLFARNERLICIFETEFGPMALILVGAIFVGSIETKWTGEINHLSQIKHWHYKEAPHLQLGAELGRFNMGSTVIMLLNSKRIAWLPEQCKSKKVLMGQQLACLL
ncbi:archaetidylserine decarboxylase [Candidatus Halobeggiatoa sp. HSG11]|nr:archaetidylserine decarboxylase [Candidatus Halobeggiatoa sp. HSG11]